MTQPKTISVIKATRTRCVDGKRYIVPATDHWANWRDDDAIKHHGIPLDKVNVMELREWMKGIKWDDSEEAHNHIRQEVEKYNREEEWS